MPIYLNFDPSKDTDVTSESGPMESSTEFAARVFIDLLVSMEEDKLAATK